MDIHSIGFVHCRTDVCLHLSFTGFKDEEVTERPRKFLDLYKIDILYIYAICELSITDTWVRFETKHMNQTYSSSKV